MHISPSLYKLAVFFFSTESTQTYTYSFDIRSDEHEVYTTTTKLVQEKEHIREHSETTFLLALSHRLCYDKHILNIYNISNVYLTSQESRLGRRSFSKTLYLFYIRILQAIQIHKESLLLQNL